MEALPFIILLVLVFLALPIALAIWLIARAADARHRIGELSRNVDRLEMELPFAPETRIRRAAPLAETKSANVAAAPSSPASSGKGKS